MPSRSAPTTAHLAALAETYGTPLWVYDLRVVDTALATVRAAIPDATLAFAVKANASGAVLRHLAIRGVGAEAITIGELARSLRAGIDPARVVVGGPAQDEALRALAREARVARVSLDSRSQWRDWCDEPDGWPQGTLAFVRVNPGLDPRTHEHMAVGKADSKFGLTPDEALALAREVASSGALAGFHVHAGSQLTDPSVHEGVLATLAPLYDALPQARELDLGGGFALPGYPLERLGALTDAWVRPRGLRLWLEPGRALVAAAGTLLTRVLHVKEGPRRHLIADAGMADLVRPALYGAEHPIHPVTVAGRVVGDDEALEALDVPTDVDGPLCENADRLGRDVRLPALASGDLLAVGLAGAYGLGMGSHYASHTHAAEVVIDAHGAAHLARRRQPLDALWADEVDAEAERTPA
ncbi:MAG: diaminopimelate decarboxylase [Trueperaceae bacterium]|nr:MAG: diaminopimelate decarboxylase [Trueperaceae bacterium]